MPQRVPRSRPHTRARRVQLCILSWTPRCCHFCALPLTSLDRRGHIRLSCCTCTFARSKTWCCNVKVWLVAFSMLVSCSTAQCAVWFLRIQICHSSFFFTCWCVLCLLSIQPSASFHMSQNPRKGKEVRFDGAMSFHAAAMSFYVVAIWLCFCCTCLGSFVLLLRWIVPVVVGRMAPSGLRDMPKCPPRLHMCQISGFLCLQAD